MTNIPMGDAQKCMSCGKCTASCPMAAHMDVRPHQFAAYIRQGKADKLLACVSVWQCLTCFACTQRCPRGVAPASLLAAVRLAVTRAPHFVSAQPPALLPGMPQQLPISILRKQEAQKWNE